MVLHPSSLSRESNAALLRSLAMRRAAQRPRSLILRIPLLSLHALCLTRYSQPRQSNRRGLLTLLVEIDSVHFDLALFLLTTILRFKTSSL